MKSLLIVLVLATTCFGGAVGGYVDHPRRSRVVLFGAVSGENRFAYPNPLGYYQFNNVQEDVFIWVEGHEFAPTLRLVLHGKADTLNANFSLLNPTGLALNTNPLKTHILRTGCRNIYPYSPAFCTTNIWTQDPRMP